MDGNVYLKTVNFGGFDKKEVLAYIDKLYSDIYKLQAEVKEKNEMIESLESGEVQNFAGKEDLEARIDEGKSKISELQASNDTLKLQVANYESDVTEKDQKITEMENEIEDLKQKLENAEANAGSGGASEFDLGSVFIEAQKTANNVVNEARKAAKKMENDAKELQNQVLDEANAQAESIVNTAKSEAEATVAEANAQAEATIKKANNEAEVIREKSAGLRSSVLSEYTALNENVAKLSDVIRELFGDNMVKLDSAKELVEQGLELVNGNSNFNYSVKGSGVSEDTSREDNNESDNNPNETNDESLQEDSSDVEEYRNDDVEAMQAYFAKLQAEAEKAVAAEEEERQAQEEAERLAAEEEARKVREKAAQNDSPKIRSSYSKSFDLDMLSALTKEIESRSEDENDALSDEDFLEKWEKK